MSIKHLIVTTATFTSTILSQINLKIPFLRERQDRAMPKYPGRFNPANFGKYGHCYCICEKPGQFPCPSRVPHPEAKKPKFWQQKGEATG